MNRSRGTTSFHKQVADALVAAGGPLAVSQLAERLLGGMPRRAAEKKVRAALKMKYDTVVRVGRNTYDLIERRLRGARFRYRPSPTELQAGILHVDGDLMFMFSSWQDNTRFDRRHLDLSDGQGRRIDARSLFMKGPQPPHLRGGHPVFIRPRRYALIAGLGSFYSEHRVTTSDDLMIGVKSTCPPRYSLSVERAGSRDDDAIQAADDKLTETCYDLLNRTRNKRSDDFSLMYRLAGVCDFRRGPIPHVPMLILPRDPRFVVFDTGLFFLRGYVEQDRITDFKESMEPKEMETLLQGMSAMADATEHLGGLTRPEIREMLPSSATEETLDALVDRLQPQEDGLESEISNAMQGICFDRARLLRGLWPDEPDPDSPEDWLRRIGVGT